MCTIGIEFTSITSVTTYKFTCFEEKLIKFFVRAFSPRTTHTILTGYWPIAVATHQFNSEEVATTAK